MLKRYLRRTLRSIRIRTLPPKSRPLILLYHRVADAAFDPWGLAVSPRHFEEHLAVLSRTRRPIPLTNFIYGFKSATLPDDAVAVTFDDGYFDNLVEAKPRLAAADVPATIFLATGYLGQTTEFWWDELARLILGTDGPRETSIMLRGRMLSFDLSQDTAAEGGGRRRGGASLPAARLAAHMAIWKALRSLRPNERETVMAKLRNAYAGAPRRNESGRPMTLDEVRLLIDDGLVAIAPHTDTHPAMTELDVLRRHQEIIASKHACEALSGTEATAFSYPFGDMDNHVRESVRVASLVCACTTRFGSVSAGSDVLALPRIEVADSDGDRFERMLRYAAS